VLLQLTQAVPIWSGASLFPDRRRPPINPVNNEKKSRGRPTRITPPLLGVSRHGSDGRDGRAEGTGIRLNWSRGPTRAGPHGLTNRPTIASFPRPRGDLLDLRPTTVSRSFVRGLRGEGGWGVCVKRRRGAGERPARGGGRRRFSMTCIFLRSRCLCTRFSPRRIHFGRVLWRIRRRAPGFSYSALLIQPPIRPFVQLKVQPSLFFITPGLFTFAALGVFKSSARYYREPPEPDNNSHKYAETSTYLAFPCLSGPTDRMETSPLTNNRSLF
jgi:hypothetical protein